MTMNSKPTLTIGTKSPQLLLVKSCLFGIVMGFTGIHQSYGQQFEITSIEKTAEEVVVNYDLLDTTRNRFYTVYLYLISDSTIAPVKHASGDVGLEVKPGVRNQIRWAAKKELGSRFKGRVQLEVRGKVYVPFIEFESFPENQGLKRGKTYPFAWSGKSSSNILSFKLYKGDELKVVLPEIPNTGDAEITMPKSVKPGKYRFVITDSRNKDQIVNSPIFIIERRVPFLVKLIPVALIGGTAPLWWPLVFPPEEEPLVDGPPGLPSVKY